MRVFKYIGYPIFIKVKEMNAAKGRTMCDMRGMLSFQILFLLSRRQMHGEQLATEIGKRRGEKPKAGTIYPALKELRAKKLILGKRSGKLIVYALTPLGRETIKYATDYFCRAFSDIIALKK